MAISRIFLGEPVVVLQRPPRKLLKWYFIFAVDSVAVLEESHCPWGTSRISLQVLVLEPQVLVLLLVLWPQVLVLGPQSPLKLLRTVHSANSPLCIEVHKLVTATIDTVKNSLLTDIRCYLLIVSKWFFTVSQCCCPWGKSFCSRILDNRQHHWSVDEPTVSKQELQLQCKWLFIV